MGKEQLGQRSWHVINHCLPTLPNKTQVSDIKEATQSLVDSVL